MSFSWDKQAFPLWKDKVSFELIEIRQQITILANQIKQMQSGGSKGTNTGAKDSGTGTKAGSHKSVSVRPLSSFEVQEGQMSFGEDGEGLVPTEKEEEGGDNKFSAENIKQSSYYIQQATISMRGYLMLLEQAGLSKDQKKMIGELETAMMAIMKIAATITVIQGIMTLASGPAGLGSKGIIQLIMGGGYASSAMAYGMKTIGGGIS